jgi:hypothetical protein
MALGRIDISMNLLEVEILLYVLAGRSNQDLGSHAKSARTKLLRARNELNPQEKIEGGGAAQTERRGEFNKWNRRTDCYTVGPLFDGYAESGTEK